MTAPEGHIVVPGSAPTTAAIEAHGQIAMRMGVLKLVGVLCTLLIVGAFWFSSQHPEQVKDIWVIVGPIISAALSGSVGFLAGGTKPSRR